MDKVEVRENGSIDYERREARKMLGAVRAMSKINSSKKVFSGTEIKKYLADLEKYFEQLERRISQ